MIELYYIAVFLVVLLCGIIFTYGSNTENKNTPRFALLYFGAAISIVLTNNLLIIFVLFELMMLAGTFIIFGGRSNFSRLAGIAYFKFHILSGALFFIGAILYYKEYGCFEFLSADLGGKLQLFHYFLLASLLINLAMPPFSSWLVEGYSAATPVGSVFLSVGITKVAMFLLIKIFLGYEYLTYIGIFMAVYGTLYAASESNIRRIMNYYIISQLGLMVIAFGIGLNSNVMHFMVISEIVYIALMMMIVSLTEMKLNVGKVFTILCLLMFCAVASSLPSTPGYINKYLLYHSPYVIDNLWLKYTISAISLGAAMAVGIRIPALILAQKNNKKSNVTLSEKIPIVILICFTLLLGVVPEFILEKNISLFGAAFLNQIFIFVVALLGVVVLSKIGLQCHFKLSPKKNIYYLSELGQWCAALFRSVNFKRLVRLKDIQVYGLKNSKLFKLSLQNIIAIIISILILMLLL